MAVCTPPRLTPSTSRDVNCARYFFCRRCISKYSRYLSPSIKIYLSFLNFLFCHDFKSSSLLLSFQAISLLKTSPKRYESARQRSLQAASINCGRDDRPKPALKLLSLLYASLPINTWRDVTSFLKMKESYLFLKWMIPTFL